jgi:hypothetical protein
MVVIHSFIKSTLNWLSRISSSLTDEIKSIVLSLTMNLITPGSLLLQKPHHNIFCIYNYRVTLSKRK